MKYNVKNKPRAPHSVFGMLSHCTLYIIQFTLTLSALCADGLQPAERDIAISAAVPQISTFMAPVQKKPATIGVYYYDGWSDKSWLADDPNQPWAKDMPRMATKRLVEGFPEREPVWGWRHDSQEIMERQIDLAADHGIDFFVFCWYWKDSKGSINTKAIENLSAHKSMALYLEAKNKDRLKYGLLVANHEGSEILGADNWNDAVRHWTKYFKDPHYVTVDGRPLVVVFNPSGISNEELAEMQETAKKEGFKNGLAIAGCRPAAKEKSGFTHRTNYAVAPNAGLSEARRYEEIVQTTKKEWAGTEQQPYIPLLTAGWDKRPWEGIDGLGQKEGSYYPDSTPEKFRDFLTDAIQWMNEHPKETTKEKLVLIYAWNELGEGGYLVPTKGDPNASYLKQIKNILEKK